MLHVQQKNKEYFYKSPKVEAIQMSSVDKCSSYDLNLRSDCVFCENWKTSPKRTFINYKIEVILSRIVVKIN